MSTLFVIAYDTPDDRRRRRLARLLEGYGVRVQDSVFECWLDGRQRADLVRRLRRELDEAVDKVRIYTLCGRDVADVLWAGCGSKPADRDAPVL